MTNPPCPTRALTKSHDLRALAARCIRAEGMLQTEIDAREALEADNRTLRAQLARMAEDHTSPKPARVSWWIIPAFIGGGAGWWGIYRLLKWWAA